MNAPSRQVFDVGDAARWLDCQDPPTWCMATLHVARVRRSAGGRIAMAINQDAVERLAEASALRVLVQTLAVLVFEQSGLPPDRVRALGQSLSAEMSDVVIPGASEADLDAIREANARAVVAAFGSVADAMRGTPEINA